MIIMNIKHLIIALAILLLTVSSILGSPWLSFTNSNDIRQIIAQNGIIWGATSGGIIGYSPIDNETSKMTNTDGLGGIDYICAEADTSGSLWFGSGDGWLSKISDTGEIINYPIVENDGFFERRITVFDLAIDGEVLWIASDLGVSKFLIYSNGGEIKDTAKRLDGLEFSEDVLSIAVIEDNIWAGTAVGLAFTSKNNPNIQDPRSWRSFDENDFPFGRADINTIAAYYDTVVVGVDSGLFKLEIFPDTNWVEMGSFLNRRVRKIIFHNNTLYVSTHAGISAYDGTTWSSIPNTGLPSSRAGDIAFDSADNLWAATFGSGLAGFEDTSWVLHSIPGPASNIIKNMAIDLSGALWMTHDGKGLSKFIDGEWTIYNSANSDLEDNGAFSITVGGNGDVWVGSWGNGMYRYDGQSWDHWTADNSPMIGVPGTNTYWAATDVEVDTYGNVWVSSLDADSGLVMGVFAPGDSLWHLYFEGPNTISENTVGALLSQGNSLWVGTTQGLHKLNFGGTPFNQDDDSWQNYLSREFVSDLALDPFGNLWFASPTGLYYVNESSSIVRQVELHPDISGSVKAVASDGIGNIWVGTVAGAGVLRPDKATWRITYTMDNSPLLNNEVSDIEIDIETGMVYLGTFGGLSIFDSGVEPPSEDLSDIEAYPNPVLISRGDNQISFKRVPSSANVSIYTVAGDLVASFALDDYPEWNLKNSKGEPVAAGIYFFIVDYQGKSGMGKFAIIK